MILPILLFLWIGGVEVTGALSVDRRLNNLASSIGDLASRSKRLTWTEVDDIFGLAPAALFPYAKDTDKNGTVTLAELTADGLSMRITAVSIDGTGKAVAAWSRAKGTVTAHATNAAMNTFVPESLRVPNTQIIMSEVFYSYSPAVGYVVTGAIALTDKMFFVPRLTPKVQLCETSAANSPCVS